MRRVTWVVLGAERLSKGHERPRRKVGSCLDACDAALDPVYVVLEAGLAPRHALLAAGCKSLRTKCSMLSTAALRG